MPEHFLFYLALSFFYLHEMDAVRCREWRIFPLLSLMSDKWGKIVFIVAHLPLFLIITIQLNASDNERFITGMSFFFIVHLFMHIVYLRHKNNEFNDWISWGAIIGNGAFGLVNLLV